MNLPVKKYDGHPTEYIRISSLGYETLKRNITFLNFSFFLGGPGGMVPGPASDLSNESSGGGGGGGGGGPGYPDFPPSPDSWLSEPPSHHHHHAHYAT